MIKDKVKDKHSYFYCTECGAEIMILKYYIDPNPRLGAMIDYEASKSRIEAFVTLHRLCKTKETGLQLVLTASRPASAGK